MCAVSKNCFKSSIFALSKKSLNAFFQLASNWILSSLACCCSVKDILASNFLTSPNFFHFLHLKHTLQNKYYLEQKKLKVAILTRGTAWLDTGTFSSLLQASQFVEVIENRQGLKIGCIEEIAYRMDFINAEKLRFLGEKFIKSGYGEYLLKILEQK